MTARSLLVSVIACAAMALTACATALPPPQASLAGIQAVRKGDLPAMRVGSFTPAPGAPTRMDRSIQVRADAQPAPPGGYARYLGDTLAAELNGSGKLDPGSAIVISGVVTDTHVDSAMPTAHAWLEARITVQRGGATVFDKALKAEDSWTSNFQGVVAIPDAFNHYTQLFRKLVETLLSDPEFVRAVKS